MKLGRNVPWVKLYQNCSKNLIPHIDLVAMATKRKKKTKSLKIFFSETRRGRALIFGMQHLLVDLYQDCSYDAPGVEIGPVLGITSLKHRNKDGKN